MTTAQDDYRVRWQRIMDCVGLEQPDRMPVVLLAQFWLARYGGITYRELMYDYEKAQAISGKGCCSSFDPMRSAIWWALRPWDAAWKPSG